MCSEWSRLAEEHAAALLAYHHAATRMKETRDREFERAWRLAEQRRLSVKRAWQALSDHEHSCATHEVSSLAYDS